MLVIAVAIVVGADPAFAGEGASGGGLYLPIGVGITMGLAAIGGTLSQGKAVSAALEAIGRNPSAGGSLLLPMIVGLVFIESLVIFAFVIANGLSG